MMKEKEKVGGLQRSVIVEHSVKVRACSKCREIHETAAWAVGVTHSALAVDRSISLSVVPTFLPGFNCCALVLLIGYYTRIPFLFFHLLLPSNINILDSSLVHSGSMRVPQASWIGSLSKIDSAS